MSTSDPLASTDSLVDRLARLDTGQVSDVLDEAGLPNQVLAASLRPLQPGTRLAGRAACIRGEPIVAGRHAPVALPSDAVEQVARPGSVLIVAAGGFVAGATLGGFVAHSLQRQGCRGVLTDGAVRDADEIRSFVFPVFAAAVTPVNGSRRWQHVEADRPVVLPGQSGVPVTVCPGDLVLGDADGVVIVPAGLAEQIVEDSEQLRCIEEAIGAGLRAGQLRRDAFRQNPRFGHVRGRQ